MFHLRGLLVAGLVLATSCAAARASEPLPAELAQLADATFPMQPPGSSIRPSEILDFHDLAREAEALFGAAFGAAEATADPVSGPSRFACAPVAAKARCRSSD